jgi:sulfur carrier protein ThiS
MLKIPNSLKTKIGIDIYGKCSVIHLDENKFTDIRSLLYYLNIEKEELIAIKNGIVVHLSEPIEENDSIVLTYLLVGG